jgi:hypothetical protein
MEQFKSFIARRRWKVHMKCESRSVRTVTTKYVDNEGNVKSKKRAELSGKSVVYEGEYSETDSEAETEFQKNGDSSGLAKPSKIAKETKGRVDNVGAVTYGLNNLKVQEGGGNTSGSAAGSSHHKPLSGSSDSTIFKRQKLVENIPNIELKPVKMTEFSESIDEHSDEDRNDSSNTNNNNKPSTSSSHSSQAQRQNKVSQAEMQAKINSHLSFSHLNAAANSEVDKKNIIKDETKEDEKSDIKIIDSTDEKTGQAIRTSIENKMKTNENIKVLKGDETVDVKETEDAIIKKITTKTKTTKSVVKTTTTTTTKKGTLRIELI